MSKVKDIQKRLVENDIRYWAGDNISSVLEDGDVDALIGEATIAFEQVLQTLLIDTKNDPNSMDTAKRLAKMYYKEIMSGRYTPAPRVAAFPNIDKETAYHGMITIRAELSSLCSHHHQPVRGVAYIGLIPKAEVIGLSKYARIAQHCARRGTLQEELCRVIGAKIMEATGSEDVGVYIQATHGCMENRGVCAHSSLTQTTVLHGQFYNSAIKDEFYNNIKLQQMTNPG
jgi:GTP cyclohydrolase I